MPSGKLDSLSRFAAPSTLDTQASPDRIEANVASLPSTTSGTDWRLSLSPYVGATPIEPVGVADPQSQSVNPSFRSSTRTARSVSSFIGRFAFCRQGRARPIQNDLSTRPAEDETAGPPLR
jgi:hypothetical protein